MSERCYVLNSDSCARVSSTRDGVGVRQKESLRSFIHIFIGASANTSSAHFNSRKAHVNGQKWTPETWQRYSTQNWFFQTWDISMFDTLVFSQFLSDFFRMKSNVSPRLSTSTYPREYFDRTIPLIKYVERISIIDQESRRFFSRICMSFTLQGRWADKATNTGSEGHIQRKMVDGNGLMDRPSNLPNGLRDNQITGRGTKIVWLLTSEVQKGWYRNSSHLVRIKK